MPGAFPTTSCSKPRSNPTSAETPIRGNTPQGKRSSRVSDMKIRKTARASSWPVFSPFGPALMAGQRHQVSEVLDFWFVQSRLRQWFAKDPAFDALLRERFLGLTRRAIAGELDAWNEEPSRGLALSLMAMERGRLEAEDEQARRQFWLMPLMHSEDLAEQEAAPAAVRAVQRSPHRRLRPPAPGCDRPLWPLPPPQCCSGAGVERGGAGLPADAGLPLLNRLSVQPGKAVAATGARKAASPAGASGPRA